MIVIGRKWYWMLGYGLLLCVWMKLFVLKWLFVLRFVLFSIYLRLIFGWFYYLSVGYSEMGFLYLYWMYIFRWFCRFWLMLGRLSMMGMLSVFSYVLGLMFECCSSCGDVIVLLYMSIL